MFMCCGNTSALIWDLILVFYLQSFNLVAHNLWILPFLDFISISFFIICAHNDLLFGPYLVLKLSNNWHALPIGQSASGHMLKITFSMAITFRLSVAYTIATTLFVLTNFILYPFSAVSFNGLSSVEGSLDLKFCLYYFSATFCHKNVWNLTINFGLSSSLPLKTWACKLPTQCS